MELESSSVTLRKIKPINFMMKLYQTCIWLNSHLIWVCTKSNHYCGRFVLAYKYTKFAERIYIKKLMVQMDNKA